MAKQAARRASSSLSLILTLLPVLAALSLTGCSRGADEATDCPAAERARSVSGFCVPRWVSLRHGEVMGRKGPGRDYPALWVYRVQGLPVQIVAETEEWRRICDPNGGAAWVHRSEIDGRRTVLSRADSPTPMLSAPRAGARTSALLNAHALARLDRCAGDWCKLKAGGASGWTPRDGLWGLADEKQCR